MLRYTKDLGSIVRLNIFHSDCRTTLFVVVSENSDFCYIHDCKVRKCTNISQTFDVDALDSVSSINPFLLYDYEHVHVDQSKFSADSEWISETGGCKAKTYL